MNSPMRVEFARILRFTPPSTEAPPAERAVSYGLLRVDRTGLRCGRSIIPVEAVREAVLFDLSPWPCFVLRVRTERQIFQFSLARARYWRRQRLFPLRIERAHFDWRPLDLLAGAAATASALAMVLIGLSRQFH